ncbi:MAG: carboxypeptidase regulatory-like domain-containing protein [Stenotrophobium sp.]
MAGRTILAACLFLSVVVPVAFASDAQVNNGVSWLESQVSTDGSLVNEAGSIAIPIQTRTETLETLSKLASAPSSLAALVASNADDQSTETLARQAISLQSAGGSGGSYIETLQTRQNDDGGFGDSVGAFSNSLDTAWALLGFKAVDFSNVTVLSKALQYLIANANEDGGFASSGTDSSVYVTAYALLAMDSYRDAYQLSSTINNAILWLQSVQGDSENFGDILDDALGAIALEASTTDTAKYAGALSELKAGQMGDGSWVDDPYLTALVLRALSSAGQVPPPPTSGSVTGIVRDGSSMAPLPGVTINVSGNNVITDSSGQFSLLDIPAGSYTLTASKVGYGMRQVSVAVNAGAVSNIGSISLNPAPNTGLLRGVIVDAATNAPIANASITVTPESGSVLSALTGADGAFQISGVPDGDVTIVIQSSGYQTVSTTSQIDAGITYTFSPALYTTVSTSPTTASITGRVMDSVTASPIIGATVTTAGGSATTGSDGSFTIGNLTAGQIDIQISAAGYVSATYSAVISNGNDQLGDIRLQQTATSSTLLGVVTDASDGTGLAGATLTVEGTSVRIVADSSGNYRLDNLPGTKFTILVEADGYVSQTLLLNATSEGTYTENVSLNKADSKGVKLSASTEQPAYDPFSDIEISVIAQNELAADQNLVFTATIYDSQRNVYAQVPFKQLVLGQSAAQAAYTIPGSSSLDLGSKWYNLNAAAGDYTIVISASDISGQVIAQASVGVKVNAQVAIGGGITLNPPITQAGTAQPVSIKAAIGNHGNLDFPGGPLSLKVVLDTPDTSVPSTTPATLKPIVSGNPLSGPRGGIYDASGNFYVANYSNRQVIKIAPDGSTSILATLPAGNPVDIALEPSGNVAVLTASAIYSVSSDGTVSALPITLAVAGGLAVDSHGNNFVTGRANDGSQVLEEVTPVGDVSILVRNGLSYPIGIASGQNGDIYVSNNNDNSISIIDQTGQIHAFVSTGLNRPWGLLAESGGGFLIADNGSGRILRVAQDGTISVFATGIPSPEFMSYDQSGNILVTSGGSNDIYRVSSAGVVDKFGQSLGHRPTALGYAASGILYAADADGSLHQLATDGTASVLASGVFSAPQDMAISPTGDLYVSDSSYNAIKFYHAGVVTTYASGLSSPFGLTFDGAGNLYVAESTAGRISRVNTDGTHDVIIRSLISSPVAVLVGTDGTRYVLNSTSLTKIPATGQPSIVTSSFGGTAYAMTFSPSGGFYILVDRTKIIHVADDGSINARATVPSAYAIATASDDSIYFSPTGVAQIDKLNPDNSTAVFTTLPSTVPSLAVDNNGDVIASDYNSYLYRITPDGTATSITNPGVSSAVTIGADNSIYLIPNGSQLVKIDSSGSKSTLVSGLSNASSVAVGSDGSLSVVERYTALLKQFDNTGMLISTVAGIGTPDDIEWFNGKLYFADTYYGRICSVVPGENLPAVFSNTNVSHLKAADGQLFATSSNTVYSFATDGSRTTYYSGSGLTSLQGIDVSSDGLVAVANANDDRVVTINSSHQIASSIVGLGGPVGIVVDESGNVYVANSSFSNIVKFTPNGKQAVVFATVSSPRGLALDANGGILVGTGSGYLDRISQSGTVTTIATGGGSTYGVLAQGDNIFTADAGGAVRRLNNNVLPIFALGISDGRGIKLGADDSVYVAGGSSGAVTRYNNGALSVIATNLLTPQSLAFDETGNLLVAGTSTLYSIDSSGAVQDLGFGALLSGADLRGISFDPSHSSFTITSNANSAVLQAISPQPVTVPESGTVVYTASGTVGEIPVGTDTESLDFGSWTPQFAGDYSVHLSAAGAGVAGDIVNMIHVGPHADAAISVDQAVVSPGNVPVTVSVSVTGADFASVSQTDAGNLRQVATSARPQTMGADPAGNIYFSDSSGIEKIVDGSATQRVYSGTLQNYGLLPIDALGNLYGVTSTRQLIQIAQDGSVTTLVTFPTNVTSIVNDSHGNIIALYNTGTIVRVNADKTLSTIATNTTSSPFAMTIDGADNLYVLNRSNTIIRLTSEGVESVTTSDAQFEYEGMSLVGDCSNNLLLTPDYWTKVGQSGEEHTLAEIFGSNNQAASVLNGSSINPRLNDIDFIVYDRYNGSLLMWTDENYAIFRIPVTCGAISTDLHITLPAGQTASGFNIPPSTTISNQDGSSELTWDLQSVTNLGQAIQFDTTLNNVELGDQRPVASDAYLLFTNTFTGGNIKLPLTIPSVAATGAVALALSTDQTSYPANAAVGSSLVINNPNGVAVQGNVRVDVLDASGNLVTTIYQQSVSLDPSSQLTLNPLFNTGAYLAGGYSLHAVFNDQAGFLQGQADTSFAIIAGTADGSGTGGSGGTGSNTLASLRVTTDKATYNTTDAVNIADLVQNLTVNAPIDNASLQVQVLDPSGAIVYTQTANLGQLSPGAVQQRANLYGLKAAAQGNYTVKGWVLDGSGNVIASGSAIFKVLENLSLTVKGTETVQSPWVYLDDPQACTDVVTNTGTQGISNLSIHQVLVNLDTGTLDQEAFVTASLAPGASQTFTRAFTTNGLTIGHHACAINAVINGNDQPLAHAPFEVRQPPVRVTGQLGLGDKGRLLVLMDSPSDSSGGGALCNSGLGDVSLEVDFDHSLSPEAIVEVKVLDILGLIVDTETTSLRSFTGEVNAKAGSSGIDLSIPAFTADSLVLQLAGTGADHLLGGTYRIVASVTDPVQNLTFNSGLISLTCNVLGTVGDLVGGVFQVIGINHNVHPGTGPGDGQDSVPADQQKATLQSLLAEDGWSYDISTNKDDFASRLRSGGYQNFALFSEYQVLDEQVQKEVREAVFGGNGLLNAGRHDVRRRILDNPLGIEYRGTQLSPTGLQMLNGNVFDLNGQSAFSQNNQVQRVVLEGATADGNVISSIPTAQQALVTHYQYGNGLSAYAGFDLLAEASAGNPGGLFADLIRQPLLYVNPSQAHPIAGRVVPVRLSITNSGIANTTVATISTSLGAYVVAANSGTVSAGKLTWTFSLGVNETQTVDLWIQLPPGGIPVTLTASLVASAGSYTANPVTVTYTVDPVTRPGLDSAITDLSTYVNNQPSPGLLGWLLDPILGIKTPAAQALQELQDANTHLGNGQVQRALTELVQATDLLINDGSASLKPIRLEIDEAIFQAEKLQ